MRNCKVPHYLPEIPMHSRQGNDRVIILLVRSLPEEEHSQKDNQDEEDTQDSVDYVLPPIRIVRVHQLKKKIIAESAAESEIVS